MAEEKSVVRGMRMRCSRLRGMSFGYVAISRGVSTSYSYDGAGNLVSTAYSDGTPSIACAYDRSGNMVSAVTDGVATNLYAYSDEVLLTNEVQNGAVIVRSYDSHGRPTGYTLTTPSASQREVSYTYDALGRIATVTSGTNVFSILFRQHRDRTISNRETGKEQAHRQLKR